MIENNSNIKYGFPYMGSKSKIAKDIINIIPKAENFYDLFAGGCAITHAAILSGKWKKVIANDIQGTTELFLKAMNGEYKNEKRWISREDFFRLKDSDPFIRWVWSFGNNGSGYLFGKDIEEYKKQYHYLVCENIDFTIEMSKFIEDYVYKTYNIKELCKLVMPMQASFKDRRLDIRGQINIYEKKCKLNQLRCLQQLQQLERLEQLQQLQHLGRLDNLKTYAKDYREIEIKPNSVVYCDIPYNQKENYKEKYYGLSFDTQEFYQWCKTRDFPVYFSSCFCDDNFECVFEKGKQCLMNNRNSHGKKVIIEKLYWNGKG